MALTDAMDDQRAAKVKDVLIRTMGAFSRFNSWVTLLDFLLNNAVDLLILKVGANHDSIATKRLSPLNAPVADV